MASPRLSVNVLKQIPFKKSLWLPKASEQLSEFFSPDLVEVPVPAGTLPTDSVTIRIMSHKLLSGMVNLLISFLQTQY